MYKMVPLWFISLKLEILLKNNNENMNINGYWIVSIIKCILFIYEELEIVLKRNNENINITITETK